MVLVSSDGKTYEGRTLYYLVIANPAHRQRREEIRAANLQLADPRKPAHGEGSRAGLASAGAGLAGLRHSRQRDLRPRSRPADGVSSVGRPGGLQTRKLLDDAPVLIDPLQNPDGHERFVNVYRETRGTYPDPQPLATEHTEPAGLAGGSITICST